MHEIVMVIADLYLPPDPDAQALRAQFPPGCAPGVEYAGRFGTRAALGQGWRGWLAPRVGRADLDAVPPAQVAAAALRTSLLREAAAPAALAVGTTVWIATPVHLVADLTRVHLAAPGLLRLSAEELARLAAGFARAFAGSGLSLYPLPCGELLLFTPGMNAIATVEPARALGGALANSLPHGPAAAPLRRLFAEIEMWLHAEPLNDERARRGEPTVTALWPWGGAQLADAAAVLGTPRGAGAPCAFGADAWLDGLCRLQGAACAALPREFAARAGASLEVWVLGLGALAGPAARDAPAGVLAQLDARYVSPVLAALRAGTVTAVTLIANDVRVSLAARSAWRRWRRARPGVTCFLAAGAA